MRQDWVTDGPWEVSDTWEDYGEGQHPKQEARCLTQSSVFSRLSTPWSAP